MAEQPIIIKGGSLKIKSKGKFKESQNSNGWSYDHEKEGTITKIEIDNTPYKGVHKDIEIVIYYDVPDASEQAQ